MTDYEILYNLTLCIVGAPTVFAIVYSAIYFITGGFNSRKSHR